MHGKAVMESSVGYKVFLLLHLGSVVVAFAPVAVALLPGGRRDGLSATAAAGRSVYAPALVAVGLFGALAVVTSDDVWEFSQAWVSLAFLVWIAMNGVLHAMVLAGHRRADTKRVERGEQLLTALFVLMLYLMIWKPGL